MSQLRKELSRLNQELEKLRSAYGRARSEADQAQSETINTREELLIAKSEIAKLQTTLKLRDDEIAFLRAHVHQLSEKLPKALPESTTEGRNWWRFWK